MNSQFELNLIAGLTRRLPALRGAGVVANTLIRFYNRKPRPPVDIEARGVHMRLCPRDSLSEKALTFYPQLYDRHELAYLGRRLQAGGVLSTSAPTSALTPWRLPNWWARAAWYWRLRLSGPPTKNCATT